MSRNDKYIRTEIPQTYNLGNGTILKHFVAAGVVQLFNLIPNVGYSKGVTIHLDKLDDKSLQAFSKLFVHMVNNEASARRGEPAEKRTGPFPEAPSYDDAKIMLGGGQQQAPAQPQQPTFTGWQPRKRGR
jgi:hypothetical protein